MNLLALIVLMDIVHPATAHSSIPLAEVLDENGRIINPYNLCGTVDFSGFIPFIDDCNGLLLMPAPPLAGTHSVQD